MSIANIGRFLWDRDLIIAAAALVLSLVLLNVYMRAVRRSMMRTGARDADTVDTSPTHGHALRPPTASLAIENAGVPLPDRVRAAWSGVRNIAIVQIAAGLIYALVVTLVWGWFALRQAGGDRSITVQWVLLFTLYFAWPVVIVLGLVATTSWRARAGIAVAYLALLAAGTAIMMQGTPVTPAMVVGSWWHINGAATVIVLVILARPIRAMGPIVVALTVAAALGVFGTAFALDERIIAWVAEVASALGLSGRWGGYIAGAIMFGIPALGAAFLAFLGLRLLGRLYRRRWLSDQTIQADALWLTFAVLQAPSQLPYLGVVVFPLYKLVTWLGYRLLRRDPATDANPPKLLLLRVFSLGARSGRLFEAFSLLWRHKGAMRLIAGPDLANATVEPHEFLDFLAGRLDRRFIASSAMLDARIAEAEARRDPDGRFRVQSFFCHDDTWRMVLRRLARDSDLVLMDLRGFTPANQGCVYELNELMDAVPFARILLVVDATTDEAFLGDVLRQGWSTVSAQSVNRRDPDPRLRLFRLETSEAHGAGQLVATLSPALVR